MGSITRIETLPLLNLSKWAANVTLYYEDKDWGVRVSDAYRSQYLTNTGNVANTGDGIKGTNNIDFQAHFNITPKIRLVAEGINLTNEAIRQFADINADRCRGLHDQRPDLHLRRERRVLGQDRHGPGRDPSPFPIAGVVQRPPRPSSRPGAAEEASPFGATGPAGITRPGLRRSCGAENHRLDGGAQNWWRRGTRSGHVGQDWRVRPSIIGVIPLAKFR